MLFPPSKSSHTTAYLETKLKLKVNHLKSAVDRPNRRVFLGYSFTSGKKPRIRVPAKSTQKMKAKLKQLFRKKNGGESPPLHQVAGKNRHEIVAETIG